MTTFNSDDPIQETEYVVEGFIPKRALTIITGKSGTGKSIFIEDLLIHIKYNKDFLGFKTIRDVDTLLIDLDTPTEGLKHNLAKRARK